MWAYFGVGISRLVTWVLLRWKLGTFDFERYNHISPRIWTCMIFVQKWCNNFKIHPILNYPKILSTSMWYVSCFDMFVWILSQPAPANSRSVVATTVTSWAASWSWIGNMPRRLPGLSWPKGLLLRAGENEMHNILHYNHYNMIFGYIWFIRLSFWQPDPSSTCSVLALASSESMSSQQT